MQIYELGQLNRPIQGLRTIVHSGGGGGGQLGEGPAQTQTE